MSETENLREFLRDHQIRNMRANMDEWFAFVCYAHSDSDIVQRCAIDLYRQGYNLWIDVANLPHDEHSWEDAAMDALHNDNCRQVLFFRSRDSVTRPAIASELSAAADLPRLRSDIITIDVGDDTASHGMDLFYKEVLQGTADLSPAAEAAARTVFSIVHPDNNALAIPKDADARQIRTLTAEILELPHATQFYRHTGIPDLLIPDEPEDTARVPSAAVRRLLAEDPECIALTAAVATLAAEAELEQTIEESGGFGGADAQDDPAQDLALAPDLDPEDFDMDFPDFDLDGDEEESLGDLMAGLGQSLQDLFEGMFDEEDVMDQAEIGSEAEQLMRAIQEDDSFETLLDALEGENTEDGLDVLLNTMNQFAPSAGMPPLMRALRGDEELAAMLVGSDDETDDESVADRVPSFTLDEIVAEAQAHGDLSAAPADVLQKKLTLLCGMRILRERRGRYSLDSQRTRSHA